MIDFQIEDVFILLTPVTVFSAIISGFLFGHIFHKRLNTTSACLYTAWIMGVTFCLILGLARSTESDVWERWIGVAILYTVFVAVSWVGRQIRI